MATAPRPSPRATRHYPRTMDLRLLTGTRRGTPSNRLTARRRRPMVRRPPMAILRSLTGRRRRPIRIRPPATTLRPSRRAPVGASLLANVRWNKGTDLKSVPPPPPLNDPAVPP
jgi:hypothetical protein